MRPETSAEVEKQSCIPIIQEPCTVDPNFEDGYSMVAASCGEGCVNGAVSAGLFRATN